MSIEREARAHELDDAWYGLMHRWHEMQDLDTFIALHPGCATPILWQHIGDRQRILETEIAATRAERETLREQEEDA